MYRDFGTAHDVEQTWRCSKSELAMERPRLETWERRHKLLLLATLAYAFLLSLLDTETLVLTRLLLRWRGRRTGRRRTRALPLCRLRSALRRLWQEHPPTALAGPLPPLLRAYPLLRFDRDERGGLGRTGCDQTGDGDGVAQRRQQRPYLLPRGHRGCLSLLTLCSRQHVRESQPGADHLPQPAQVQVADAGHLSTV
jgi:hypothetical protein